MFWIISPVAKSPAWSLEGQYIPLLKWTQKCRIVFSPAWVYLKILYQHIFLPFPESHTDSDMLTEKLEHVWSFLHTLSKPWESFIFLRISPIRNMSHHKAQFTEFSSTNFTFFCGSNWWRITWRYWKQACCAGCRADPSQCNSTSRQNPPFQQNRRSFWSNTLWNDIV